MAAKNSNRPNKSMDSSNNRNQDSPQPGSNMGSGRTSSGSISGGSSSAMGSNAGRSQSTVSTGRNTSNISSPTGWSASGSSNPGGSAFGSMASGSGDSSVNPEIVSKLTNLIETCKDGQLGFKEAAEGVENAQLKSLFQEFSQQRAQFADELQNAVQSIGAKPEASGHISGAMHRAWINLKSAVTGHDEKAILAECERGEDYAVKAYEEARSLNLPSQLKSVVERQFQQVKAAHDKIHQLEESDNIGGTMSSGSSGMSGGPGAMRVGGSGSVGSGSSGSSGASSGSGSPGIGSNFSKNPTGTSGNMSSNSQVGGSPVSGNMSNKSGNVGNGGNKPDSRSQF